MCLQKGISFYEEKKWILEQQKDTENIKCIQNERNQSEETACFIIQSYDIVEKVK